MELQLCSDLFLSLRRFNCVQHEMYILLRTHLVRYDTVVVEVTDNREVKEALSCAYIRYVRYPLLVRTFSNKVPVKQIRIALREYILQILRHGAVLHLAITFPIHYVMHITCI